MSEKDARFNRRLALLVLGSFMMFAVTVVLRLGIAATPYDAVDSVGRPMGFNDRLGAEHYLMMLRNFNPLDFFRYEYRYEWVLGAAHVLGAVVLLSCGPVCRRATRLFFVAQTVVFPFGIVALPFLPSLVLGFITGRMDREGFVDIPFILVISQPVWVVSSIVIAIALRGKGLGLAKVWNAFTQATRAGLATFTNAMRNS